MQKLIYYIPVLITLCFNAHSQHKSFSADTFRASSGFSAMRLLLYPDSTFFIASSNCQTADIAKGIWYRKNNVIRLMPDTLENDCIKPIISRYSSECDSIQIFKIVDRFKKPIRDYNLIFFDSIGRPYDFWTNVDGIVTIEKGKFVSYFTAYEMESFDFSSKDLMMSTHQNNANWDFTLQFNYPVAVLTERPRVQVFKYAGDEFSANGKLLKSNKSRLVLYKQ